MWQTLRSGTRVPLAALMLAGPLVGGLAPPAAAQQFPGGKPIEMTVMFGAGSAADVTARQLAEGMSKQLATPVVAVNRTGGGGAAGYTHVAQQRPDGSFPIHPYAVVGELSSTTAAWAALHLCGAAEPAERARGWVLAHGGVDAVIERMAEGDLAALLLAMAGLIDARRVPCPDTSALLLPPVRRFLETRFHSGVFMGAMGVVAHLLGINRRLLEELRYHAKAGEGRGIARTLSPDTRSPFLEVKTRARSLALTEEVGR